MSVLFALLVIALGYLLGNFSTGIVVAKRLSKVDIRKYGSGASGGTNMLRVLGSRPALFTVLGDMLKGVLATLLGLWLGGMTGAILGCLSAVVGHIYPVFFGFKGGKGIATTFGSLLVLFPLEMVLALAVFLVVTYLSHYVSLGSVVAAVVTPMFILLHVSLTAMGTIMLIVLALLVIFAHRANIKRLIARTENVLDFAQLKQRHKTVAQ